MSASEVQVQVLALALPATFRLIACRFRTAACRSGMAPI